MALCKNKAEESVYFSRHFLMDRSSVFFFLLRPAAPLLLDRAERTDLFVEGHQVLAELLEAVKLADLLLRLAQRGGIGKGFRHRLAGHAASETKLGVMSGVVAFGAVAGRLAAASGHRGNGTGSQIAQAEELPQELGSLGLQSSELVKHKGSPFCNAYNLNVQRRSEVWHKKGKPARYHFQVAHPPGTAGYTCSATAALPASPSTRT